MSALDHFFHEIQTVLITAICGLAAVTAPAVSLLYLCVRNWNKVKQDLFETEDNADPERSGA